MKKLCDFKVIEDERGILTAFDKFDFFNTKRFYVIDCYENMWRGKHYHKIANQLISVIKGCIEVELYSKTSFKKFIMYPGDMFLQTPGYLFKFKSLEQLSRLIVLSDKEHDQSDYYTDFGE